MTHVLPGVVPPGGTRSVSSCLHAINLGKAMNELPLTGYLCYAQSIIWHLLGGNIVSRLSMACGSRGGLMVSALSSAV